MASTISYAKVVRNQKDDEKLPSTDNPNISKAQVNLSKEIENKPELAEKDDPSFKEVSNVKKVWHRNLYPIIVFNPPRVIFYSEKRVVQFHNWSLISNYIVFHREKIYQSHQKRNQCRMLIENAEK